MEITLIHKKNRDNLIQVNNKIVNQGDSGGVAYVIYSDSKGRVAGIVHGYSENPDYTYFVNVSYILLDFGIYTY